jgi:hypothetical protein
MDDLMYSLDRKSENGSDNLQCFTFPITLTDEVVAFFFGNMLLGNRHLREWNAPIAALKQPNCGGIQGG